MSRKSRAYTPNKATIEKATVVFNHFNAFFEILSGDLTVRDGNTQMTGKLVDSDAKKLAISLLPTYTLLKEMMGETIPSEVRELQKEVDNLTVEAEFTVDETTKSGTIN